MIEYKQIDTINIESKSSLKRRLEETADKFKLAQEVVKWNWWDYHFQLEMIDRMLEICEKHWGVDTHYVGDQFTKGRIVVIRSYYKKHKEADTWEEESRYLSKFLKGYARLVVRLWD